MTPLHEALGSLNDDELRSELTLLLRMGSIDPGLELHACRLARVKFDILDVGEEKSWQDQARLIINALALRESTAAK